MHLGFARHGRTPAPDTGTRLLFTHQARSSRAPTAPDARSRMAQAARKMPSRRVRPLSPRMRPPETQHRPRLSRPRRSHPPRHRRKTQRRTPFRLAPGRAPRHHPGRRRATPAGARSKRPGANRKVGRVRTCRIEPAGLSAAEQWIADRRSLWENRFDRLGDLLNDEWPPTKPSPRSQRRRFIDQLPDPPARRRPALVKLLQSATGEKPKMWGPSIIGFGAYHYKYESGREGDMPFAFRRAKPPTCSITSPASPAPTRCSPNSANTPPAKPASTSKSSAMWIQRS